MKSTNSYLHTYLEKIVPKLQEIDIYIKSAEGCLDMRDVANVLELSESEVLEIICANNIKRIEQRDFFRIMETGSSFICGLYRRELECGSPFIYTRKNIAYIYQIDIDKLDLVCDSLGISEVTSYTLPYLLAQIAG